MQKIPFPPYCKLLGTRHREGPECTDLSFPVNTNGFFEVHDGERMCMLPTVEIKTGVWQYAATVIRKRSTQRTFTHTGARFFWGKVARRWAEWENSKRGDREI